MFRETRKYCKTNTMSIVIGVSFDRTVPHITPRIQPSRPAARGLGAGRALVERIIDEARALGYAEMVLDTLPMMAEAQHLYQAFGFRDIPQYCENPIPGARYLGRSLAGPEMPNGGRALADETPQP